MASKWIAHAVFEDGKGFRHISGYMDLKKLVKILQSISLSLPDEGTSPFPAAPFT